MLGSHSLIFLSSLNIVIDKKIFIMVASYPQGRIVSAPMALLIYFMVRLSSHSVSLILEEHFLSLTLVFPPGVLTLETIFPFRENTVFNVS